MSSIRIYCDGACRNNGNPSAAAGYGIYVSNGHTHFMRVPIDEPQTNQRAELLALAYALNYAAEISPMPTDIYSDSKYALDCIGKWGPDWKLHGWIKSNKKPIQHLPLIQTMLSIYEDIANYTSLNHIRSHTGGIDIHSQGNAEADKLANSALE